MVNDWQGQNVSMKYLVSFILDKKNNRPNEARIRMRVKWGDNLVQRFVPYTVEPEKWSKESKRCIPNTTHGKYKTPASRINKEIQAFEDKAHGILKNGPVSKEDFERLFDDKKCKENKKTPVEEIYGEYVKQVGGKMGWSLKYKERNETVITQLLRFNPNIKFSDLEKENTITKFIAYLNSPQARMNVKNPTEGIKNSTVERYISMLKRFLKWAKKQGQYKGEQHDYEITLKQVSKKAKQPVFLTWEELNKLYNHEFDNPHHDRIRDCLCFMCFTSLRYSDLATLTRDDVKEDHIITISEKSDDRLRIDLNKYSKAILEKYKDQPFEKNLALPVISNQKMNDSIKEIGKILEFNDPTRYIYYIGPTRYNEVRPKYELLSCHTGRRTFIVNSIYLGIPTEVVMSWTGHEDYESMRPYIAIVQELKNKEMEKFNESPTL